MRRKNRSKTPEAKRGFDALMDRICGGMGFCGSVVDGVPRHVTDYIPDEGLVTADQFVDWVLLAEGMDPQGIGSYQKPLKEAFVSCMRSDQVSAQKLSWNLRRKSETK